MLFPIYCWGFRTDGSTSSDEKDSTPLDFISLLSLSPLGEFTDQRKSISLILLGILLLSALSILDSTAQNHIKTHTLAYASHAPIKIIGDAGFLSSNASTGITNGNGTALDPYIIYGWDINASTAQGIRIENTSAHFTVMDCYIHGGSSDYGCGVMLVNCINGTLARNNFSENRNGIRLDESRNIVISDNNCSNNKDGIHLGISSNITIDKNTCSNNEEHGIYLDGSGYVTISDNNCSGNFIGINFFGSWESFLSNNTCISNSLDGICIFGSSLNTLNGNTCSNSSRGIFLEMGATRNILIENTCSNNNNGIEFGFSSNNSIVNNSCNSNRAGIYLYSSSSNTLSNNSCMDNLFGIELESSSDNEISNNSCSDNDFGIDLWKSSNNILSDNGCKSNHHGGISLRSDYLVNLLLPSDNNTLSGNSCSNNHDGILLFLSSNNSLINNTCSSNDNDGIVIDSIGNLDVYGGNSVTRNWIFNNTYYGVEIPQGSRNLIWNNTFIGNNGATDSYNASHVQAFDGGKNNSWNSTDGYGNFWKDWTTPDSVAPYGRVDSPYNIDGLPKAKDCYPLTAPRISDPPYIPISAPSNMLIPILVIAAIAIAAIVLTSFIILRKRKGKKGAPD